MIINPLSSQDIEQFIRDGVVLLRGAFSAETAAACRALLWREMGLSEDDPGSWSEPVVHLKKTFTGGPFDEAMSERFYAACDQLLGAGRYHRRPGLGWWPVSFPGHAEGPWRIPTTGWHVDGQQFHHHLDSPDQALLPIFLLSDIGPGDGGTACAAGSHRLVARHLRDHEPEGVSAQALSPPHLPLPDPATVFETNGAAGDVALLHPFCMHARSINTGHRVRFICNPCISFKEKMRLNPEAGGAVSPVEQAILQALAVSGD